MVDEKTLEKLYYRRQGIGRAIFFIQDFVLNQAKKDGGFAVDQMHVRFLHHLSMQRLLPGAGYYRKETVIVGDYKPPPANQVQGHMRDFVHQLNKNWKKWDVIEVSAFAIWQTQLDSPIP